MVILSLSMNMVVTMREKSPRKVLMVGADILMDTVIAILAGGNIIS